MDKCDLANARRYKEPANCALRDVTGGYVTPHFSTDYKV